jgi:hypothetical protein
VLSRQDRICRIDENVCTARPDHAFGSKREKLNVSKSRPLRLGELTSKGVLPLRLWPANSGN